MDNADNSSDKQQIPADDLNRKLTDARLENDKDLKHVAVVGDIYTILISGKDTNGQYCLIDMEVMPGGGPPPHRHDFEEMFTLSEGELELMFRGEKKTVKAGETVNIPRNAPHSFKNVSDKPAKMLCVCSPAGQDDFFLEVGDLVESKDSKPPELSEQEKKERMNKSKKLASKYKTEILI